MSEKIILDQDECIGCETCVEICPSAFVFDEDEVKAAVKDDADASDECVDEAIAACPVDCINKE